jgi:hypothetical protein
MRTDLKALGLALLAAFAMSAVVASAAHATSKFTTANGDYPVVLTGTQEGNGSAANNYFESTTGNKVHCPEAAVKYEATITEARTSVTVTPHYGSTTNSTCISTAGGLEVTLTVHLNGCHFVINALANTSATDTHGSAQLVCPSGTEITITTVTCVTHIPPQTISSGITYTNIPAHGTTLEDYITVDVDVQNAITYTETDAFLCPYQGNTHTGEGDLRASVRVKGFVDSGNPVNHSTTTTAQQTNHPTKEYPHTGVERDIHVK